MLKALGSDSVSLTSIFHIDNFTDVTGITCLLHWCHAKGDLRYVSARKGTCKRENAMRKIHINQPLQHEVNHHQQDLAPRRWCKFVEEAMNKRLALLWMVMGTRCGNGSCKEAAVHFRIHQSIQESPNKSGFKVQLFFNQLGASCKAEPKPILINPCKKDHLTMHVPAGLDVGLNNKVSYTL